MRVDRSQFKGQKLSGILSDIISVIGTHIGCTVLRRMWG